MARSRSARWGLIAVGAVAVAVVAAGAAAGGYLATDAARPRAKTPTSTAPAPPAAYARDEATPPRASSAVVAPPVPARVRAAIAAALGAPGLGGRVRAEVVDVQRGDVLFARDPTAPAAPASTAKLLTATAILTVHRSTDRFRTTVVRGPGSAVTLVGGGDPTLTCAAQGHAAQYAGAARMTDLARALRAAKVRPTRIVVDDGLFTGPDVSPYWAAEDVPSSYASPITALVCDGGRSAPGDVTRSATPDLAAGAALARELGTPALPVARGHAPAGAAVLGSVRSATVGTLVTEMLHDSDNVIAEMLGRQVAMQKGQPPSFSGTVKATRQVLRGIGVDPGADMHDASGLAASDRLTAAVLARLMQVVSAPGHGPAGPARDVLAALPVAAWSGTLRTRYLTGSAARGAGDVRAKTGTLTGVSSLAGLVRDRSGGLLAFAFLADRVGSTADAEAALDAVAAALAACRCSK